MAVLCLHGCVPISMGLDSCIFFGLLAVPIHQPTAVVLQSASSCVALPLTRLSNTPLETACEVRIIASLSQLRVLEFGIIYDGSSQHADVPRALEAVGELSLLQVRGLGRGLGAGVSTHSAYNWRQHLLPHGVTQLPHGVNICRPMASRVKSRSGLWHALASPQAILGTKLGSNDGPCRSADEWAGLAEGGSLVLCSTVYFL
jgi:hypothetical protein